jgi:hypothetical protein
MRVLWKPFKAVAQQRKQRLQYKNEKKMRAFRHYMTVADELFQLCMDEKDTEEVYEKYEDLPSDFKLYVWAKYDRDKKKVPLGEEHMAMDEAWRMLQLSCKTALQEREARKEATRLIRQQRAVNALCRHKMRKCINNMTVY